MMTNNGQGRRARAGMHCLYLHLYYPIITTSPPQRNPPPPPLPRPQPSAAVVVRSRFINTVAVVGFTRISWVSLTGKTILLHAHPKQTPSNTADPDKNNSAGKIDNINTL